MFNISIGTLSYCMRKMLRKIPGSNWMCEECKFAEEINSQKQGNARKEGEKTTALTVFFCEIHAYFLSIWIWFQKWREKS